jgi:hypothetical protein
MTTNFKVITFIKIDIEIYLFFVVGHTKFQANFHIFAINLVVNKIAFLVRKINYECTFL